jgi:hypothetical protein
MELLNVRTSALPFVSFSLGGLLFGQQTSGNLVGTMHDSTATSMPGVQVTAHDNTTGIDVTATTTSAGEYRFNIYRPPTWWAAPSGLKDSTVYPAFFMVPYSLPLWDRGSR